jgi:hypothetical protein
LRRWPRCERAISAPLFTRGPSRTRAHAPRLLYSPQVGVREVVLAVSYRPEAMAEALSAMEKT